MQHDCEENIRDTITKNSQSFSLLDSHKLLKILYTLSLTNMKATFAQMSLNLTSSDSFIVFNGFPLKFPLFPIESQGENGLPAKTQRAFANNLGTSGKFRIKPIKNLIIFHSSKPYGSISLTTTRCATQNWCFPRSNTGSVY